jgi:folate-binding protein YgfZ
MEKDKIIILKNRGVISIFGSEAGEFLQNIITNDINKVTTENSIFSALLTPQGKYLYEFFIVKSDKGYFLDCEEAFVDEIINNLKKYKLRSKVELENISSNYVIGIINKDKFGEVQREINNKSNTITYRDCPLFIDPRDNKLGARILSPLEKIYLTIKKLSLDIIDEDDYFAKAYMLGIPEKGLEFLKDQLFGLEANLEALNAIDFKKGCYIGQENTARMKLKNKLRRKLMPIKTDKQLKLEDEVFFKNSKIGKVLIDKPYPFALIKMYDPDFKEFKDQDLTVNGKKCKI